DASFTLVAVNDIIDAGNLTYLLKYDSLYATFPENIVHHNGEIAIGDRRVVALQQEDPSKINWKQLNVDMVLECSGRFTNKAPAVGSAAKKNVRSYPEFVSRGLLRSNSGSNSTYQIVVLKKKKNTWTGIVLFR